MAKLTYSGGMGFENAPRTGKFEVKADSGKKEFTTLAEAKLYYESLNEEKAIWDINGIPELIESHTLR